MDFEPDVMPHAVDEILAHWLTCPFAPQFIEVFLCHLGEVVGATAVESHARFQPRDQFLLNIEDEVIYLALPGCKSAVHGHGSRDIGGVVSILAANVNEHQFTFGESARIGAVVQRGRVRSAPDNQRIRRPETAPRRDRLQHYGHQFVLEGARSHPRPRLTVSSGRSVDGFLDQSNFTRRLDAPHALDLGTNV